MSTQTETLLDDEIPEKFKDPETGAIRLDAMMKSYKELEKKLSSRQLPPSTPDEYHIDCSHGLFENDEDVNERLHQKGFTNEQAQEVYNLAAERIVPMVAQINQDVKADRELEKLIEHFGGPDKWKEVARQLLSFGKKNMPEDVLDNLSSSFEGVKALYGMMQSQEPTLKKDSKISDMASNELELQSMMRNPKYWRDKDPAFVAKVTEGFKTVYGS